MYFFMSCEERVCGCGLVAATVCDVMMTDDTCHENNIVKSLGRRSCKRK